MSITSFEFYIFAIALLIVYFLVPRKWQWVVLLIASFGFYATAGVKALILLALSIIVVYLAGLQIEKINVHTKEAIHSANSIETKRSIREIASAGRRVACVSAVIVVLGIWAVLKFGDFFVQNINAILQWLRPEKLISTPSFILPLGISFYTFHAVGYLVDVYRGKYPAERNFFRFALFVSYFPHIIQGPFSRFDALGKTLFEEHRFSYDRLCKGCRRILWGLFKKLCVADKFGIAVEAIFTAQSPVGLQVLSGAILYSIQIYADFSAYMDIVCGLSHIMGIELAENFNQPYFAKSIEEFWRRWHITLGQWFRDYVFYPISMSKPAMKLGKQARQKYGAKMGKLIPSYAALIFVWTATGLWHGANWTFVIWGWLNLAVIIFSMQFSDTYDRAKAKLHIRSESKGWQLYRIARTFLLVSIFRVFSRADTLSAAVGMIGKIFTNFGIASVRRHPHILFSKMEKQDMVVAALSTCFILLVEILQETGKWESLKEKCPIIVRNVIYVGLIFMLILFAGTAKSMEGFLYANF